jgi:hypothetical protein
MRNKSVAALLDAIDVAILDGDVALLNPKAVGAHGTSFAIISPAWRGRTRCWCCAP